MAIEDSEDERHVELSTIAAIFPELSIDPQNPFSATLDIEVAPLQPLSVAFEPLRTLSILTASEASLPTPPNSDHEDHAASRKKASDAEDDLRTLTYLPSIHLQIYLPEGYPESTPPELKLSTKPSWLPSSVLQQLEAEGPVLWEDYGRGQTVYGFIDHVQQAAESGFGLLDQHLRLTNDLKIPMVAFDRQTKREKFEQRTFNCGICLEPKRGAVCYQLRRCDHVFCVGCLQDFYNSAITEGDVIRIRCLEPSCGRDPQKRDKKSRSLHPTELLDIPLSQEKVQRYVDLKIKKRLESDKSTVYCPREWCQGPARTKKYNLTNDITSFPDSDSEPEDEPTAADPPAPPKPSQPPQDRLAICSVCAFAFCRVCSRSWHGELIRNCQPRNPKDLTAEERASYDYIRMHTSPCPTCSSPVQKTMGCNHMQCYQCDTHFCYLCSAWLKPDDPYRHFNDKRIECYQRLWELEGGDEGPDGPGAARGLAGPFVGARAYEAEFIEDLVGGEDAEAAEAPAAPEQPAGPDPWEQGEAAWPPPPVPQPPEHDAAAEERRRQALQQFLQMAANDEEDGWDSDDLELGEGLE